MQAATHTILIKSTVSGLTLVGKKFINFPVGCLQHTSISHLPKWTGLNKEKFTVCINHSKKYTRKVFLIVEVQSTISVVWGNSPDMFRLSVYRWLLINNKKKKVKHSLSFSSFIHYTGCIFGTVTHEEYIFLFHIFKAQDQEIFLVYELWRLISHNIYQL